jgi:hypothetical protein
MKRYFEAGDQVKIKSKPQLEKILKSYFENQQGRDKIINDIAGTDGIVYAVAKDEGHIEVLYRPSNKTHTWKLPVSCFI